MPKPRAMMISLMPCLALSLCASPGDFCDVVSGPILFPADVAKVVVAEARGEAEQIHVQNGYGATACGWVTQ